MTFIMMYFDEMLLILTEDGVEEGGGSVGTRASRTGGSIPPRF